MIGRPAAAFPERSTRKEKRENQKQKQKKPETKGKSARREKRIISGRCKEKARHFFASETPLMFCAN